MDQDQFWQNSFYEQAGFYDLLNPENDFVLQQNLTVDNGYIKEIEDFSQRGFKERMAAFFTERRLLENQIRSSFSAMPEVTPMIKINTVSLSDLNEDFEFNSIEKPKKLKKRNKHVCKACVHCKKAHLACDESRPCTRCSQLGKTDCIDVQHKRRGRPRLASTERKSQKKQIDPFGEQIEIQ